MEFKYQLLNLKCGGCANTINKNIADINGVSNIVIDVENSTISGDIQDESLLIIITNKLTKLGYPSDEKDNNVIRKARSFVSCATGKIK